jgi:hypothetical protein
MPPSPTLGQPLYEVWLRARDTSVHDQWARLAQRDRTAWDGLAAAVARQSEAFEALLTLVAQKAKVHVILNKTDDGWRYRAEFGEWQARAGAEHLAREALKDVIRTALLEETGGADAAS